MKNILIVLGLILAIILQFSVAPFFLFYGVVPNLVLVLALFISILEKFDKSWKWIIFAGLLLDLFSSHLFGLSSLCLVTTVYIISLLNVKIFSVLKFWIFSILIIVGTMIYGALLYFSIRIFQGDSILNFKYLFIESLYNLVILAFLYGFKKILYKE
ncbi:rod shape-determining protein MreD [Patescibacteria group bacterium]